jgi:hypothetical protein
MSLPIEISTQLREWAELAGYTLTPGSSTEDGRAVFWSDGGEIRHFIGIGYTDWFVVTDSDRLGSEYLDLAAPSMATIETYFFGKFGRFIRSRKQLPRVHMPVTHEEISAGFVTRAKIFDGVERLALIASDGLEVAVSSGDQFSGTAELAKLSLYLTANVDDIKSSYLNPSGKPLFTLQ